MYSSGNRSISN